MPKLWVKIEATIRARQGSRRLTQNIIQQVSCKPMLVWVVEACLGSRYPIGPWVSSESDVFLNIAREAGARTIKGPDKSAEDQVLKQDVICQGAEQAKEQNPDIKIVIAFQASSAEIRAFHFKLKWIKELGVERYEVASVAAAKELDLVKRN